jgi:hypothetical protein
VDSIAQQRDNKGTVVEFLGGIVGPHCAECAESVRTRPLCSIDTCQPCVAEWTLAHRSPLHPRILPEPYWHVAD